MFRGLKRSFYNTLPSCDIYMFHQITDNTDEYLNTCINSVGEFEQIIKDNIDNVISINEFEHMKWKDREGKKLITLDDGYVDNFNNAYPILEKYGCPAIIFVSTNNIGKRGFLSEYQMCKMQDSGLIYFGSHAVHHIDLCNESMERQQYEIKQSKQRIESIINRECDLFSFPYGHYNRDLLRMCKREYKYSFAVSGLRANIITCFNYTRIPRINMSSL